MVIQWGEAHLSLGAATGSEPLSPDIHPIIIKLSLQGGLRVVCGGNRPESGKVRGIKSTAADIQEVMMETFSFGGRKILLNSRSDSFSGSRGPGQTYQRG